MIDIYKLTHKKRNLFYNIMMIFVIVISIIIISFVFYLIGEITGFGYMFFFEFIFVIIAIVIYAKRKLIEFTYYLEKRKIRIDRIYSARPKLDLLIEFKNIVFMGKYSDLPDNYKSYKKQMETFRRVDGNSLCIVHLANKKYFNAILSPSKEYTEKIMNRWNDFIDNKEVK